ncbi:MAG: putative bifunctional diguanylate cyclase/phosphodiesterase [Sphingomonadales bacterium]
MVQAVVESESVPDDDSQSSEATEGAELSAEVLVDHLPIGIFVVEVLEDGGFRCAQTNSIFSSVLQLADPDLLDCLFDDPDVTADMQPFIDHLESCVSSEQSKVFEWSRQLDREITFLECHVVPVADDDGTVRRVVGTVADRTLQRRSERQLLHDALHDNLTSLPNRGLFIDRLERASLDAVNSPTRVFGLLLINIDRLKIVNESLGHLAGDELLIAVALRLQKCVRPEDTLARLGGDEFALLLDNIESAGEARAVAEMIHKRMRVPLNLGGAEVFVSLSIGIAERHGGDTDIESLMSDASLALGKAKTAGKSRTEVYTHDIKQRPKSLLQLETDLRRAIAREEFELYYQPLISMADGRISGFEALCRWNHPDRGLIMPGEFIPLAEETGLILDLGRWTLWVACKQQKEWMDQHPTYRDTTISVNVSSLQFNSDMLVSDTRDMLAQCGIGGANLKLEITESVIMEKPDLATLVLNELRTMNIKFAVDDFGTGYSSLSYLNRFPIDTLKIDRSFVKDMHESEESYKIVQILASLAATLDLTLVAEGVETVRQLADLQKLGCNIGQGFLFSRPVPAAEAEKFLRDPLIVVPSTPKEQAASC